MGIPGGESVTATEAKVRLLELAWQINRAQSDYNAHHVVQTALTLFEAIAEKPASPGPALIKKAVSQDNRSRK
jgi:hypothetical protein